MEEIKSSQQFERIVHEFNGLIVAKFKANWCGACTAFAPKFKLLPSIHPNVRFLEIDVDKFQNLTSKFEVYSIPTVAYIKQNRLLKTESAGDINKISSAINTFKTYKF